MSTTLKKIPAALAAFVVMFAGVARAGTDGLDSAQHARVDAIIASAQTWAADPVIVTAVRERNAAVPPQFASLTQDAWKALTVLDPLVRGLTKNEAGLVLKAKRTGAISETFLSAADGSKVAFGTKTTSWSHAGKPKHDVPMAGEIWRGEVELDESTGLKQVQFAVPVLDDGKPIGVLVVGLSVSKL